MDQCLKDFVRSNYNKPQGKFLFTPGDGFKESIVRAIFSDFGTSKGSPTEKKASVEIVEDQCDEAYIQERSKKNALLLERLEQRN